ncbi:MAG: dethiobiotin synthase [Aureispira sp.]
MKNSRRYFIAGIDTNVGKTIVSAIVTQALKADYWKPIQSGDLDQSDSLKVASLLSNQQSHIHPETYRLNTPASPHYSAAVDGITIDEQQFALPQTENHLIVEGAGGLFVPLNNHYLLLDLIQDLKIPVLLVANFYLGSINHTLSSIAALKNRSIPIAGLIFNGKITNSSKEYILQYSQIPCLGEIPTLSTINKEIIAAQAAVLRPQLLQYNTV